MAGRQSFLSRRAQRFRREAYSSGVKQGAIGTGLMMQTYADVDGTSITVSQGTLARQQGVSVRTIHNHQRNLEDTGWLKVVRRGTGPGMPSEHRLAIPQCAPGSDYGNQVPRNVIVATTEGERRNGGSQFPPTMGTIETMETTPVGVVRVGETIYIRLIRPEELNAWDQAEFSNSEISQQARADWHPLLESEAHLI